MFILILLVSLKAQFHHQLDLYNVSGLKSIEQCQLLGKKLSDDFKHFNPDVDTKITCEEGK